MVNQRKAGAILSYVSLLVNAAVSFVYVPLLLGFLSTGEYGVYELIGSLIAYLSVMDLGLSTTLSRFYVRERELGNKRNVENLLAMSAIIYGILTVAAVAVGLVFNASLDVVLGTSFSPGELGLAHQMMLLVIANCLVVLPGNWFLALINANERFVFARSLSVAKYLLQVVAVLAVLALGSGALGVLVVQVAFNLIVVILYAWYACGLLGIRARFHQWDWSLFKSLFSFSFFILLNMVFDQVFWKTGQVVLGATCGASVVAVYGIACKLITVGFMQVSTGVTSVFLPKLTQISARTDDMTQISELFNRIGRIQAVLVWGVIGAFAILGRQFIELWAGPDFSDAYVVVLVLMTGLSISLVQNLGLSILQAKNKMGFRAIVYTVLALLDVLLSVPASAVYGATGCAVVATVLLVVGTGPVMNVYYAKSLGLDIAGFWKGTLPLIVPVGVASVLTGAVALLVAVPWTWGSFLFLATLYGVSYFGLLWLWGFNEYEKGLLKGLLCKLRLRTV